MDHSKPEGQSKGLAKIYAEALRFWILLLPDPRPDLYLALAPAHKGPWRWIPAVPELLARATAEIVAAGPGGKGECFYRLGLTAENPEGDPSRRGGRERTRAVAAFALDVDLGRREDGRRYPSWRVAREVLAGKGLPFAFPVLVRSGSGLHAYVPLAEVLETPDREAREQAEAASRAVHRLLERVLKGKGYDLDDTAGTERVFRVPGSWNRKDPDRPVPVRLVEPVPDADTCPRVTIEELLDWAELFGDAPREWTGELPKELPEWLRVVAERLGEGKVLEAAGEGLQGWAPKFCPACGGRQRKSGARATDTARVGILSGRLRCFRATCSAYAAKGTGGGLPLEEWLHLVPGLDVERVLELYAEAGLAEEPPVPLFPEGTPRVTLEELDGQRILERKVQEVLGAAKREPGLHVLAVTPGAGKTRAARLVLLDRVRRGGRFAWFSPNHALLEELQAELLAAGVTVHHVQGVGKACRFPDLVKAFRDRPDFRNLFCPGCEHRASCAAWSSNPDAEVILAPHASYPSLHDRGELEDRVVIVDESPPTVQVAAVSLAEVDRVFIGEEASKRPPMGWPEDLAGAVRIAGNCLRCILWDAARQRRANPGRHPDAVTGELLRELVRKHLPGVAEVEACRRVAVTPLPQLHPEDLGDPAEVAEQLPHPKHRDLARLVLALAEGDDVPGLALVVHDRKAWFELRAPTPLPMPRDAGLVVLDATGAISAPELEAAYGVPVHVHALEVEPKRPPGRVLIRSGSASRRSLCPRGQVREGRLAGTLPNILRAAAAEVRRVAGVLNRRVRLGVLTHRPIADLLRETPELLEAAARAAGLDVETCREWVGHYGLDGAATNRFDVAEVDVLLVLGDPIPPLHVVQLDAALLGLDWRELLRRRVARDLAQAVGRARSLRHPGRLVVTVGRHRPPGWEDVKACRLRAGRPEDADLAAVRAHVEALLEAGEVVLPGRLFSPETAKKKKTAPLLAVSGEIPGQRLREACQLAAEAVGAHRGRLKARGGPAYYYPAGMAPEEAEARAWAIYRGQEEALGAAQEAGKPAREILETVLEALPPPVAVLPPATAAAIQEALRPAAELAETVARWSRGLAPPAAARRSYPRCSGALEAVARWARRHAVPPAVLAGLEGLARETRSRGGPGPP